MNTKGKMVTISLPFHASCDPTPGDADVENQPKVGLHPQQRCADTWQ